MEYKDYYEILGIDRQATSEDIKKRYRILARRYHPDVSKEPDAEEKFKAVKEAYEVLKDPQKRQAYDQIGKQWQSNQGFTPPPDWNFRKESDINFEDEFKASDFSDFFEALFGAQKRTKSQQNHGHQSQSREQRGADIHSKITISVQDAFSGTERMIQIQASQWDPNTQQMQPHTRHLKIKIPAGVTQGQHIRLTGQGSPGFEGGRHGDLYLEIQFQKNRLYVVKNRDVYLTLPITVWEAALGAKIQTPTLGGFVELKIPPGTSSGTQLRLKGRGLPGNPPGDQYVSLKIQVEAPKTDAQRVLYQKIAEEMPYHPRQDLFYSNSTAKG